MEVHAHSHTERKKWTHYFWEFLMLFLAITLGFFVDNQREHYVEHQRAKILAASLFDDMKNDTSALNAAIKFSKEKIDSMDAAKNMLRLPRDKWNDTSLYINLTLGSRVHPFERTGGTYDQIKSSGSLRYFRQSLVNLLNAYDVQAKKVLAREDIDNKIILEQFVPFTVKNFSVEAAYEARFNLPFTHELYFTSTDKTTLREIINYFAIIKTTRTRAMQEYEILNEAAESLLTELRKEYHLK
jgi:hypothetical protein